MNVVQRPEASASTEGFPELKWLYRQVEDLFQILPSGALGLRLAETFPEACFSRFTRILHLQSVQVYETGENGEMELCSHSGETPDKHYIARENVDLPRILQSGPSLRLVLPLGDDAAFQLVFDVDPLFVESLAETQIEIFTSIFLSFGYALVQNFKLRELRDEFAQARAIQVSLLPKEVPYISGYDLAVISMPAREVGGDIYDFQTHPASGFPRQSNGFMLALADAAGHGLPAALQARDVITGLRTAVLTDSHLPSVMKRLNTVIRQSGLASRLVSMIMGRLHQDGTFEYVNAGHPRPILLNRSGFHELATGGMILGSLESAEYCSSSVQLQPGDSLLLFTDGATEHTDLNDCEFGTESLKDWLKSSRQEPAEVALTQLVSRIQEFGGNSSLEDDLTLILLKRLPQWL